jgi:hypothetical protein
MEAVCVSETVTYHISWYHIQKSAVCEVNLGTGRVTSVHSGKFRKVKSVSVGYGRSFVQVMSYLLLEMTVG